MKRPKKNLTIGTKKVDAIIERAILLERNRNYRVELKRLKHERDRVSTSMSFLINAIKINEKKILKQSRIIKSTTHMYKKRSDNRETKNKEDKHKARGRKDSLSNAQKSG